MNERMIETCVHCLRYTAHCTEEELNTSLVDLFLLFVFLISSFLFSFSPCPYRRSDNARTGAKRGCMQERKGSFR